MCFLALIVTLFLSFFLQQQKVIDSENKRLIKFIDNSRANDVWESRTKPPNNWIKKLPDWWYNKIEGTRLKRYMESLEEEKNQQ